MSDKAEKGAVWVLSILSVVIAGMIACRLMMVYGNVESAPRTPVTAAER